MNALKIKEFSTELHDLKTQCFIQIKGSTEGVDIAINRKYQTWNTSCLTAVELLIKHLNQALGQINKPRILELEELLKKEIVS